MRAVAACAELAGPRQESQEHFGSGYYCPELPVGLVEHEVLAGALAFGEGGAVLDYTLQAQHAAGGGRIGDADQPGCPRQSDIRLAAWLAGQHMGGHEAGARPQIDAALRYGGGVSGPGAAWQPGFGAKMQYARSLRGRGRGGSGKAGPGGGGG